MPIEYLKEGGWRTPRDGRESAYAPPTSHVVRLRPSSLVCPSRFRGVCWFASPTEGSARHEANSYSLVSSTPYCQGFSHDTHSAASFTLPLPWKNLVKSSRNSRLNNQKQKQNPQILGMLRVFTSFFFDQVPQSPGHSFVAYLIKIGKWTGG